MWETFGVEAEKLHAYLWSAREWREVGDWGGRGRAGAAGPGVAGSCNPKTGMRPWSRPWSGVHACSSARTDVRRKLMDQL